MHTYYAMTTVVESIQPVMEPRDGGVEIVWLAAADPIAVLQEASADVARTGFVPLMAGRTSDQPLPDHLRHRHVLLICPDDQAGRNAIPWVRALARASPRRHVLVRCGSPPDAPCESYESRATGPSPGFVATRLARAERWFRRGRVRAGERWVIAAAAAADRHGDADLAAQVEIGHAARLLAADRVDDAERGLAKVLMRDLAWPRYEAAAVTRTDVLVHRDLLSEARAWLTSLESEARLRGVSASPALRARRAELDFWQGRGAAGGLSPGAVVSADELGWRAMAAWSRLNWPHVALVAARLRESPGDPRAQWWAALMRVVLGAGGDADEIDRRTSALLGAREPGRPCPRRSQRLAMAVAARVWLSRSEPGRAVGALEGATGPGPEANACARLMAAARFRSGRASAPPVPHGWPYQPGVDFLASCFVGSRHMHLVDGLSGLLAVVEDAEDEASMLAGGCRWLCRQAGASAVAIVSADHTTLVAAEGWKRGDVAGEIREILEGRAGDARRPDQDASASAFGVSIRYGGVTIGHVAARGRASDRPALQQAAMALAALCGSALRGRLDALMSSQRAGESVPEIVGDGPLMRGVRDAVMRAAAAPFPVLIEGESGTGKELVARAIHRLSPRRDRRLSAVNCAALTDDLVEAELFGHTRGAFTGAVNAREGLFEEASGGTLLLDEVTELSPRAQAKLLRVLQEREIRRVGENISRSVDVRVIAACNVSLAEAVAGGRFRDDLRFRLAVIRIRLPALRERVEDIPSLAQRFWRKAAAEAGTRAVLGPDALARLTRHAWPGNVRELQNVIAGLVVAGPARGRVSARHVDQVLSHVAVVDDHAGICLEMARRTFERRVIAAALVRHAGRRSEAAVELGLTRQGLTKALRRLGLTVDEDAAGVA